MADTHWLAVVAPVGTVVWLLWLADRIYPNVLGEDSEVVERVTFGYGVLLALASGAQPPVPFMCRGQKLR
eukprot:SAG11_NODE_1787_length_4257_cov_2.349928_3_plen_70_part_00